jgi:hypothetical protein
VQIPILVVGAGVGVDERRNRARIASPGRSLLLRIAQMLSKMCR